MYYLLGILVLILALVAGMLVLRLRVRLEFATDRRLLFAGLGQTGPELDFVCKRGTIKLFGRTIKHFVMERREQSVVDEARERLTSRERPTETAGTETQPRRRIDIRGWLDIAPQCLRAVGRYLLGLIHASVVEQAEGEIEAGFEEPDVTGQVFGFYQAALAAAPGVVGRVRYTPVWTEAAFSGAMRISVALPLYKLLWQTLVLAWRLPIIRIIKLVRGNRKGVPDVEQRS